MFDFDQDGVINEYDLRRTFASLGHPDADDDEIKQMLSEVSVMKFRELILKLNFLGVESIGL